MNEWITEKDTFIFFQVSLIVIAIQTQFVVQPHSKLNYRRFVGKKFCFVFVIIANDFFLDV